VRATDESISALKDGLGPVGVWLGIFRSAPIDQLRRAARRIEEFGYGSI
jgi:hypothetical protein